MLYMLHTKQHHNGNQRLRLHILNRVFEANLPLLYHPEINCKALHFKANYSDINKSKSKFK